MINKNYIKLLRKKNENNSNFFIYEIISKRIIDSLDLIKVNFSNICEIGINEKEDFEFNQDSSIDFDEEYRSPGWDRYKKNKILKWKK